MLNSKPSSGLPRARRILKNCGGRSNEPKNQTLLALSPTKCHNNANALL